MAAYLGAVHCELLRFNPIRARRGASAALVEIDGHILWMNQRDIRLNMNEFGALQGLTDAASHYESGVTFPAEGAAS